MTWGTADQIDRTAKILIDAGKAKDPDDAGRYLKTLVLQVAVGPEVEGDPAAQAAVATVVNAGRRAFRGGVHVQLHTDRPLMTGWTTGLSASATVAKYGGFVVGSLADNLPTLVIGTPSEVRGRPVLWLTWRGWSAGVVTQASLRLGGDGSAISGVLAAGLGVSEVFQQALGSVFCGRRNVGLSLWRPELDWRALDAVGPPLNYLPAKLWLLGLGHLGQSNAWTIGMLPYSSPVECEFALMDFDAVVEGNTATQLLTTDADIGRRKTRVVASALETLGLRTRIVERSFDEHFRVASSANAHRDEPLAALAGFDDVVPRGLLGDAGFAHVVDAGLGAGPVEYLDMVLHTFPARARPADVFKVAPPRQTELAAVYEEEIARQVAAGTEGTAARCGMLSLAGVTVGAAFVGTVASTLTVADLLRSLHGGQNYSVIALDLREPGRLRAVPNTHPGGHIPKYARAAQASS